jgi:tripartite-type tricarboxylate transporter receptor subunit TctC
MSIASHAISPTLYSKLLFDAEKDFTPISMLWQVPNIFVVKPDIPAKTVPELVALVKASPGKYTFASGGSGTSPHICGEWLKQVAGLNMVHVPYRGGAPALQDLLAGQVDMEFDNIPGPLPQYKAGKLRGLAVTSRERSPVAPELPPMNDFYPGFEITSWGGLCGPAGLPPAMVEKASALCKKALESEALKTAFLAQGATPLWASPADAATFRRNDEKKLAPIIVASGANVN